MVLRIINRAYYSCLYEPDLNARIPFVEFFLVPTHPQGINSSVGMHTDPYVVARLFVIAISGQHSRTPSGFPGASLTFMRNILNLLRKIWSTCIARSGRLLLIGIRAADSVLPAIIGDA